MGAAAAAAEAEAAGGDTHEARVHAHPFLSTVKISLFLFVMLMCAESTAGDDFKTRLVIGGALAATAKLADDAAKKIRELGVDVFSRNPEVIHGG